MGGAAKYHPKEGNPITKDHTWHALTVKWILAQKLGIPKTQFACQMMPNKKEEQSMDTLVLLRRGNKIPTEGDTETKGGAESRDCVKDHPETTPHSDPSQKQLQNSDTIIDAHKYFLTGSCYSGYLGGSASA